MGLAHVLLSGMLPEMTGMGEAFGSRCTYVKLWEMECEGVRCRQRECHEAGVFSSDSAWDALPEGPV